MQGVCQEEDGRSNDEPFPTQSNDTEGDTGQNGVGHGGLAVLCNIAEGPNERCRMSRGGLGDTGRACILHRAQPVHESDRDEEHHERIVVSQSPGGMGHVCGHEGDEPSSNDASTFAKVIFGHGGDGENRQRTVKSRESEHAPPDGLLRGAEEGLQEHGTNGHRPREQRRTWVNAAHRIEAICVHNKMCVVRKDVVDNPLHVPRVRTAGHVPVARTKGVHRRHSVPLNTDGKTNQKGGGNHHSCTVSAKEEANL